MKSKLIVLWVAMCFGRMGFAGVQTLICKSAGNEPAISQAILNVDEEHSKVFGEMSFTEFSGQTEGTYRLGTYPRDEVKFKKGSLHVNSEAGLVVFQAHYEDLYTYNFTLSAADGTGGWFLALTVLSDGDPEVRALDCQEK